MNEGDEPVGVAPPPNGALAAKNRDLQVEIVEKQEGHLPPKALGDVCAGGAPNAVAPNVGPACGGGAAAGVPKPPKTDGALEAGAAEPPKPPNEKPLVDAAGAG